MVVHRSSRSSRRGNRPFSAPRMKLSKALSACHPIVKAQRSNSAKVPSVRLFSSRIFLIH
jgi:hypothetical protein